MEFNFDKREIILKRKLNVLDKFVLDFTGLLDEYVVVSGYVSILFGRSRATEDVDLIIPPMNKEEFEKLFDKLYANGFECLDSSKVDEVFETASICVCAIPLLQLVGKQTQISCAQDRANPRGLGFAGPENPL